MQVVTVITVTDMILAAILLVMVVLVAAFVWSVREDARQERQRELTERARVYAKVAERTMRPSARVEKGDYVRLRMDQPIEPGDAADAALYDVEAPHPTGREGKG